MKPTILTLFLFTLSLTTLGETVELSEKRLLGLRLSPTNSVILEQVSRQNIKSTSKEADFENLEVTLRCSKKTIPPGSKARKTYLCEFQRITAPAD